MGIIGKGKGYNYGKAIVGACWGDEGKGEDHRRVGGGFPHRSAVPGGQQRRAYHHQRVREICPAPAAVRRVSGRTSQTSSANGVALSVENLMDELKSITDRGVPAPPAGDLRPVPGGHCPITRSLDGLEEARLAAKSFGSTKSGIAPFYSDKYAKIGFQVSDLFDDKEGHLRAHRPRAGAEERAVHPALSPRAPGP